MADADDSLIRRELAGKKERVKLWDSAEEADFLFWMRRLVRVLLVTFTFGRFQTGEGFLVPFSNLLLLLLVILTYFHLRKIQKQPPVSRRSVCSWWPDWAPFCRVSRRPQFGFPFFLRWNHWHVRLHVFPYRETPKGCRPLLALPASRKLFGPK